MSFVDIARTTFGSSPASNYLRFPLDLGSATQGHYMTITIYPSGDKSGDIKTVALFIPGGGQNGALQWQMAHEYDEVKLTRLGMGLIGSVPMAGSTARGIAETAQGIGRIVGKGTINPKVDVLYANSDLREFQFDFFMAPQSKQEQDAMDQIIRLLRRYSAPEMTGQAPAEIMGAVNTVDSYFGAEGKLSSQFKTGFWFVPPAEFEIKFRFVEKGQQHENPYIPRIARSVLRRVDVNYTQQGEFSTFRDGAPTSAQLTLVFKEMRIISQADVENGY